MFCKYKNIFGQPNKGVHLYRIFNIAIVDVVCTFILEYIIFIILGQKYKYWIILIILFIIGIICHRLFCVKTTIDKFLFN